VKVSINKRRNLLSMACVLNLSLAGIKEVCGMSFSAVLPKVEWSPHFCGRCRSCFCTQGSLGCDINLSSQVCPLTSATDRVSGSLCVNDTTAFSFPSGNSDCFAAYKASAILCHTNNERNLTVAKWLFAQTTHVAGLKYHLVWWVVFRQ